MTEPQSTLGIDQHFRPHWHKVALVVGVCLSLLGGGSRLTAQNRNAGEITGTVQDSSGGVVPGVSVAARNINTGEVVRGTTNASGTYDLPYVPTGTYSVSFTKNGYEESTENGIVLHVATVTVDARLQVGKVSTQVQVDASDVALLQTESPVINLTLSSQSLTALPNIGGDWKNMMELLPGVAPGRYENGTGAGLASSYWVGINGAQTSQYNILLDGGVAANIRIIDPGNAEPPLDAITEVNINTALFGADSGNGTSTINVITKSGTNRFHGSVWENILNNAFEAKPFQISGPISPLRWNMYGFTFGGPILKNRLFFFGSFQRNPYLKARPAFYTVPEDAVRGIGTPNGDAVFDPNIYGIIYDPATEQIVNGVETRQPFPNNTIPAARIDPVAAAIMQYYPRSNEPFTNGANYTFTAAAPSLWDLYTYRMDYDLSKTNRLSGSENYSTYNYTNPYPGNPAGFFDYSYDHIDNTEQLTDVWTLSPRLLNEARISTFYYNEPIKTPDTNVVSKLGLQNAAEDVFPYIYISGGPRTPYSLNNGNFTVYRDMMYDAGDTVTWSRGKHSLKFGGEWNFATDDHAGRYVDSGSFYFTGNATLNPNINTATGVANPTGGSGLADFLLGDVNAWTNTIPIVTRLTIWHLETYAQDSYKVLPNLTVNLGLRFLHQAGFSEIHGRFANFEPTLINPATGTPGAVAFGSTTLGNAMEKGQNFFQPRLGASWSFRPSWVLRGGFGLYNVPWTVNNYDVNGGVGYSAFGSAYTATNSYDPYVFQLDTPIPSMTYPSAATLTPSSLNGSVVNYQPYNTPISYLDEYQVGVQHLIGGYLIDVAYVGTKGNNIAFTTNYTQIPQGQLGASTHPFPQFTGVNYYLMNGTSNYNSLQIQSKKQFKNGLTYQVVYTYAKSLDTGTGEGGITAGSLDIYQNSYDPMANYGPSQGDLRHTFNGSVVYELPFGKNKRFLNRGILADELLGGWQVSTAFQSHTGTPFTVVVGSANASGSYSGDAWFPNRVGSGKLPHPTEQTWFNAADFQIPAPNTFGNEGRNSVYGPDFNQVDLSAAKSFRLPKLGENTYFQFKVDAFNALNHPNLGLPNPDIYSTPALDAAAGSGSIAGGIATVNAVTPSDMRDLQLSGHIRF